MLQFILLFAPFQPTPGLAIWSLLIFLLFWFIMAKLAFKPIMEGIKTREEDIQDALDEAKKAKEKADKEAADRAAADDQRSLTSLVEKLLTDYLRERDYLKN